MQEGKAREELKWGLDVWSGRSGRQVALVTGSCIGEDAGCLSSPHSSTTLQVSGSADGWETATCHCIWGVYDQTRFEGEAQGDRCYLCQHFGFFIFVAE